MSKSTRYNVYFTPHKGSVYVLNFVLNINIKKRLNYE